MAADPLHSFDVSARRSLATVDPWQLVNGFAPHLRIAHQISGRVRLKLEGSPLDQGPLRDIPAERLRQALGAIRGVRRIQFNVLARSCVIEYDSATIPDAAWADLQCGRQSPSAAVLISILQEKFEEIRHGQL